MYFMGMPKPSEVADRTMLVVMSVNQGDVSKSCTVPLVYSLGRLFSVVKEGV